MEIFCTPFTTKTKLELDAFLLDCGLSSQFTGNEFTITVKEEDVIVGSISIDECIIKNIAVAKEYRGQHLVELLLSRIISYAQQEQIFHLFLYTKPKYLALFQSFGFHCLYRNQTMLFMENKKNGIVTYLQSIKRNTPDNGIVIMHCNPITSGHLSLIQHASQHCQHLYIFLVSDDSSLFTSSQRYEMAKQACKRIPNVSVHMTQYYQVSRVTFPDYFLPKGERKETIQILLDFYIFETYFIPILQLKKRFLGTEPLDAITRQYNENIKKSFSNKIDIQEIPRFQKDNHIISASYVRKHLEDVSLIKKFTPQSIHTLLIQYLKEKGYQYHGQC